MHGIIQINHNQKVCMNVPLYTHCTIYCIWCGVPCTYVWHNVWTHLDHLCRQHESSYEGRDPLATVDDIGHPLKQGLLGSEWLDEGTTSHGRLPLQVYNTRSNLHTNVYQEMALETHCYAVCILMGNLQQWSMAQERKFQSHEALSADETPFSADKGLW